jgi:hypothetical protein
MSISSNPAYHENRESERNSWDWVPRENRSKVEKQFSGGSAQKHGTGNDKEDGPGLRGHPILSSFPRMNIEGMPCGTHYHSSSALPGPSSCLGVTALVSQRAGVCGPCMPGSGWR